MNHKVLLLLGLAMCYTLSGMAQADGKFSEGLVKYTVLSANDMTVSATWAENAPEDVVGIPATVEHNGQTYSVTSVDLSNDIPVYQLVVSEGITAIEGVKKEEYPYLKRLELPGSLREIPYGKFRNFTGLEEVSLGEGMESLDNNCFMGCRLRRLSIPASIRKIGASLCYIGRMEEINVHPDNPYYYSQNNTLIDKEHQSVVLGNRDLFIPDNVTSIGSGAYMMFDKTDYLREKEAPRDLVIPNNITIQGFVVSRNEKL